MPPLIPTPFLFRFEFPLHRCRRPPAMDGEVDDWESRWLLPPLHRLDGEKGFGRVYACWDEAGLYLACRVEGRTRPPRCDPARFRQSDNLRVMTDMRDNRDARRATRFCQQFYFLPTGGGKGGRDPVAGSAPVARAQADAPLPGPGDIPVASKLHRDGYSLTAHLPVRVLAGFDPAESPRIGFFAILEDTDLGQQSLTVGDELNWWCDPSTWPTAVLTE
jgi:hypothetical protein